MDLAGNTISEVIEKTIRTAIADSASDIHLKSSQRPALRILGEIASLDAPELTDEEIRSFVKASCPGVRLDSAGNRAVDYSWVFEGNRFRCNVFKDSNGLCASMRLLNIPSTDFATLGIPEILKKLAERKSGLILVTGPTGSGKTTTLTCLIDYLNKTHSSHIITLEDPIEYVHSSKKSIVSQREIGIDAVSYTEGIVEALREDPDIILIGEMRDTESIAGALRAAETGHLVLSTLHTKGAGNSITRIIDVFPSEQQNQVRMQLSLSLLGVVSQQLLPKANKTGRVLATEVMVTSPAVANLIRQQKLHMINSTLENSSSDGMYTMKQSLDRLLANNIITRPVYDSYQIQIG